MLIPRFYPVMGGTENQCLLLSKELVKMNHSVFVVTQREKNTEGYEVLDGVLLYRLRGFGLPGVFSFGFFFTALFFLIANRAKYDIIHVHLATSSALSAVFAAGILGKGCLVKFAGAGKTGDIGTSARKLCGDIKLYILRKSCALFSAPSDEVAAEMISAGFNKEAVIKISNGVDCSFFSPLPADERKVLRKEMLWQGKKVFLFAGRLEEPKDIAFFLNVWGGVPDENGLFVIAGGGSQEKELKDIVEKKKMENVIFAGKRSDILRFYRASDYFVLPSHAEGLSNALLEAMSCGLTAIASDIPSNREVMEDGKDGFLFSFENPDVLAGIIKSLILDENTEKPEAEGALWRAGMFHPQGRGAPRYAARRMGSSAREKIMRNYSIAAAAENHVKKVYNRFYY